MSLGADGGGVRAMVLRQVASLAAIGAVIGLAGAYWLARGAEALLYEVRGYDPVTVILTALVLMGVALAAGYVPARRASRVDPMVALRSD
jgi:ABC-type antimicrobial peptide transport system permease subunit